MNERFQEPGWFTKHVFNRLVAAATKIGLSAAGSRVLEVKGRKSSEWRRTPVNLLEFDGVRYLVAPRGNTQWVRNMRVSGGGRLVLGRRVEEFTAKEVPEGERVPLLRATSRSGSGRSGTSSAASAQMLPTRSCAASPPTTPPSASTETSRRFCPYEGQK